ncbi:MAG: FHA domain-containing protein, partial [bacterium]
MANDHSTLSLVQKSKKDSAAATIEVLSGPSDGMEFEIRDNEMIIGREINAHIALPLEISLSRIHARITARNDEFWLEDLNSKYGTYIGSQ